jgi:hypothetical protein
MTHEPPSIHSDHSDQVPSWQSRLRTPQLPHASVGKPSHALPTGPLGPPTIVIGLDVLAGDSTGSMIEDHVPHGGVALVFAEHELL